MLNTDNLEEILNTRISGYHSYSFAPNTHLSFVSRNLCDMLGCEKEELLNDSIDLYASFVHPEDIFAYSDFLGKLKNGETSLSVQYRVIKKNGEVIYVNDSAVSKRDPNGEITASSVLTDITAIKNENNNLRFLNETIPCGFIKYTCDKHPKVTYINEQMIKLLRFSEPRDGETDYFEMYKDNIYLMIPMEERRKFSHFLNHVYAQNSPVAGEITVLRCDGTKARLYGWVTKSVDAQGIEEFQSVCMDVTERYITKKSNETERYLKALKGVYDIIFEYDFLNRAVKCVYEKHGDVFGQLHNVPVHLEAATEKWIESGVALADRARVGEFINTFCRQDVRDNDAQPPQIKFRSTLQNGETRTCIAVFIRTDAQAGFLCCRVLAENSENDSLRYENASLRNMNEQMQSLVMSFTDGMVAFEIENDTVRPLYASDNICDFFGYTKEEWLALAQKSHSIKTFVSKSGLDYGVFTALIENGEAEFEYTDVATRTTQRKKAVCTRAFDGSSKRYVMLYSINDKAVANLENASSRIYIRTFGYFDVFVDETPIAFRNKKSKELFALLTDRRGGFVTSEEAICFLWEDEPVNSVTLARYRKVALRLKNILEEYGIADIVESVDGKRRIIPEKVKCDLYDYLSQREEYSQLFKGSYLTNYSWGETTLGELTNALI